MAPSKTGLAILAFALATGVRAQQAGTYTAEVHPLITWQVCAASGTCTTQVGRIVLDADWRWLHSTQSSTNCFLGNSWDPTLCPDPSSCAQNCALDGADYAGTYGITTNGSALTLKQVTSPSSAIPGSRVYFMTTDTQYYQFKLLNREFSFDVDASQLPCGYNGALYFTQMDADGGKSKYPTNRAGAKYGTGYCDSQCSQSIHFINGQANLNNWQPNSPYGGTGSYGSCCMEMDVWQANSFSTTTVAHPCLTVGPYRCSGTTCAGGTGGFCDAAGCDFNPYRNGARTFYGGGRIIDTSSKFTVVTQFATSTGTDTGALSEIRRYYVQNGRVVSNSVTNFPGYPAFSSITDNYCQLEKTYFGDTDYFDQLGGLGAVGSAMNQGMVMALSLSGSPNDNYWLDSIYPTNAPDPTKPGVERGMCPSTPSGASPAVTPKVVFSNIKFGPIGST